MTSERELARAGLRRPYGTRILCVHFPTLKRGANKNTAPPARQPRGATKALRLRREEHGLVDLASPTDHTGQITCVRGLPI